MTPMTLIGLLFDGAQVLFEHRWIILVLSANFIGIGLWVLWGISANRANRESSTDGIAVLSTGICGFVLASYAIVAISRIWHVALPVLSNGLLIVALLALVTRLLPFIKKKSSLFHVEVSSSYSLLLR